MKRNIIVSGWTIAVTGLLFTTAPMRDAASQNIPKGKEFRIERSMPKEAVACIECHKREWEVV